MRENIQFHDTFMLFLCGASNMIVSSSSSSELNVGGTCTRKRKRKIHRQRSLQILGSQPGINELIGDYVGLLRGKEFRMLEEFNELVIEYNNTDEDGEGGGGIVNGDDNDNNLNLTNYKSNNDTYSSGNGGGGGDGCEKLVMDTEGM
mmetsp:Transcript_5438/g.5248  ORF Transcript_5438/g.5248 Transcript_5438/m.5248 type:complete len:147 (+) Transcript_5438:224-664(+)